MDLEGFLNIKGIRPADAAKELGVTYLKYWRWHSGSVIPKPKEMAKIKKWSNGAVTADDFYSQHEEE